MGKVYPGKSIGKRSKYPRTHIQSSSLHLRPQKSLEDHESKTQGDSNVQIEVGLFKIGFSAVNQNLVAKEATHKKNEGT
jgi:hypothetical protein